MFQYCISQSIEIILIDINTCYWQKGISDQISLGDISLKQSETNFFPAGLVRASGIGAGFPIVPLSEADVILILIFSATNSRNPAEFSLSKNIIYWFR